MKILIITQYFWPENFLINDLVLELDKLGHQITVLTGKPNYPEGNIFDGYSAKGLHHEKFHDSVDVFRVPLRPRGAGKLKHLLLNYLSFIGSGLRYFPAQIKKREVDVIFVFAPSPILSAITAIPLKFLKKAHLSIWVQDLWPESLTATGHLKNRFLLKLVAWLVRGIYFFADSLLIQSHAFYAPVSRLANKQKIIYYPNSIRSTLSKHLDNSSLPDALLELMQQKFCMVFAGNIGSAQSMETIVQAAQNLKSQDQIRLVIVGSGSRLEWLQQQKLNLQLDNLYLAGRFPMSVMPTIYSYAAGLLVTLKNEYIFSLTIPSKVQAYLAAGKPIVAGLNGEGARIINEAGAGITCPAEDADALTHAIVSLYQENDEMRQRMGNKGRDYFEKHFEMQSQAKNLIAIFEQQLKLKTGKRSCES